GLTEKNPAPAVFPFGRGTLGPGRPGAELARRAEPRRQTKVRNWALATIERVRYPLVLFDFDGTVVDSGGIILASMRHADETELHKPHPAPLLLALERVEADADDAAYVGDSPYDMQAARAAGMLAVGVAWGRIHDRDALSDADVVVDTAEELLGVL